jgi:hypothetical protein
MAKYVGENSPNLVTLAKYKKTSVDTGGSVLTC